MKKLILAVCLLAIAAGRPALATPALRNAYITASASSTVNLPWPSGTIAGDLVVLTMGIDTNILSAVAPWTQNAFITGPQIAIYTWSKVMTSGDISTGSITLTINSGAHGLYGVTAIQAGTYTGIRETPQARNGTFSCCTGAATVTLASSSAVLSTDFGIYFGVLRRTGGPFTVGISKGSVVTTASQSPHLWATLATDTAIIAGAQSVVYTLSAGSDGDAEASVYITDGAAPPVPGSPPSARPIFW